MAIESIFLVLSDLHFGRDFHLAPELPPLRITRMAKWIGKEKELEKFVERSCRGHSIACVSNLPHYLNSVLREAREEGYLDDSHEDNFDLCILLGDQATVPDAQSYKFLCKYLTRARYETVYGLKCDGLDLDPNKILAIPGNHDKLLRTNLDIYHQEFTTTLGVPRVDPGKCLLVSRSIGRHEFLFVLLDASVYATEELVIDVSCPDHLARGRVSRQLNSEIRKKLDAVKQGQSVDKAALVGKYGDAIKIMLVHYAVDITRLPVNRKWEERFLPHECKDLDEALTGLKIDFGLSLALHGHLHVPGLYNHTGAQVVSATTTTEQKGPNGFFVLKLLDTGEIRAEHHCWTGRRFTADPDTNVTKPLEKYPRGAVA